MLATAGLASLSPMKESVPARSVQPGPVPGHRPGLHMDREGRWFHDGDPVRHARLAALLSRSVARDEAGRLIVTTGRDVLAITTEDAPVQVRTVRSADGPGEGHRLVLSTGREEPLSGATILIDDDGRMRVPVEGGTFWALFLRPAAQAVIALEAGEVGEGSLVLRTSPKSAHLVAVAQPYDWTALAHPRHER